MLRELGEQLTDKGVGLIVSGVGRGVALAEAQPGDVVFYGHHYAMYIGGGKIVHAYNSRRGICVTSVHDPGRILTIRRLVEMPVE